MKDDLEIKEVQKEADRKRAGQSSFLQLPPPSVATSVWDVDFTCLLRGISGRS